MEAALLERFGAGDDEPTSADLESQSGAWRLLVQIDSDREHGLVWPNGAMSYVCIRAHDLVAGRYDRVQGFLHARREAAA